ERALERGFMNTAAEPPGKAPLLHLDRAKARLCGDVSFGCDLLRTEVAVKSDGDRSYCRADKGAGHRPLIGRLEKEDPHASGPAAMFLPRGRKDDGCRVS